MFAAGINFGLYFAALRGTNIRRLLGTIELRVYAGLALLGTIVVSLQALPIHEGAVLESFRRSAFTTVSILTSTGFGVVDLGAYPTPALMVLLLFMFIGGSSGSTAGGLKVSRLVILVESAWSSLRRYVRPQVVGVVRLDNNVVDDETIRDVTAVFVLYVLCLCLGSLAVSWTDSVDAPTAMGAMLSALSNMGPTPFHGPADNFAGFSPTAQLIFSVAMLLGRLEFMTVLVLLLPDLWRK
jgi:trk system potassium uptake protein TrkH